MAKSAEIPVEILRKNIRRLLVEKRWSQARLAEESGMEASHLSKYLNHQEPGLEKIGDIADAFNLTVAEILTDPDVRIVRSRVTAPTSSEIIESVTSALELQERLSGVPEVFLEKLAEAAKAEDGLRMVAVALRIDLKTFEQASKCEQKKSRR